MQNFIFLCTLFVSSVTCFAQVDSIWATVSGGIQHDRAQSILRTDDGGLIVVGSTASFGAGAGDVWLLKYDSEHTLLWSRTFGGSGIDQGWSVKQTVDGGFVIAGMTQSQGAGSADGWLIKTDSEGNMVWNRTFGTSSYDWLTTIDLAQDDGFILGGVKGTSAQLDQFWLVKTDSLGNHEWQRTFGGSDYDQCMSVIATDDGGYAMTGNTNSFSAGRSDVWVVRTNSAGDSLWARSYGGEWGEGGRTIVQTFDGGFAVAGKWREFRDGDDDFWLVRLNESGDTLWTRSYGFQYHDECNAMIQTSQGEFILAGFRSRGWSAGSEQFWFVTVDGDGTVLQEGIAGGIGQDMANGVTVDNNGNIVLAGETYSFGSGLDDVWLVGFGNGDWLEITSPNGGEFWNSLTSATIRWNSSGFGSAVNIRLNRDYPQGEWEVIDELQSVPNTGSVIWNVHGAAGTNCRLWIESAEEHSLYDVSDGDFTILRGSFRVSAIELQFGEVLLDSTETMSLTVMNDGPDSLLITGITSDHADFEVADVHDALAMGGTRVVEVTFTANMTGFQQAGILIQTSAGDFSIHATAIGAVPSGAHDQSLAESFEVLTAFPNPFNNATTLAYSLPAAGHVSLRAYDVQGRMVQELVSETQTQGEHRMLWDGSQLATGTYIVVLSGNGFQSMHKAILLK